VGKINLGLTFTAATRLKGMPREYVEVGRPRVDSAETSRSQQFNEAKAVWVV